MAQANGKEPVCYRYPQMFVCGCTIPCKTAMKEIKIHHIKGNVYIGPIQAAYSASKLINNNIKYIIDLSDTPYHTQPDLFHYTHVHVEGSFVRSQFLSLY